MSPLKPAVPFIAAVLIGGQALAMTLPRYDVEAHCDVIADFSGGSSILRNSCIDMEQDAYNRIKAGWSGVSDRTAAHCDEVASFGGPGSYSLLESCIKMEQDADQSPSTFTY